MCMSPYDLGNLMDALARIEKLLALLLELEAKKAQITHGENPSPK